MSHLGKNQAGSKCGPPLPSPAASQALSTSRVSSTEGAGAVALLYSGSSKAQSLDQGYPRKSVAAVRADTPDHVSPRLQLAGVLQPKLPLKSPGQCRRTSWPEIRSAAPHAEPSQEARARPLLTPSAGWLSPAAPVPGHNPSRRRTVPFPEPRACCRVSSKHGPSGDAAGKEERARGTKLGPREHRKAAARGRPFSCWDAS